MKKGVWIANFCPLCTRKVIPDEVFTEILKALSQGSLEKALKILYKVEDIARFDILIPKDKEVIKILEDIPTLYPLCKDCFRYAKNKDIREKIEKSISQNKHMLYKVENFSLKRWVSKPREGGCIF